VVGLGNPGPQYAETRHNAGFWLVDQLARQHAGHFRPDAKFHGDTCRIALTDRELWLLKPMTFMNRSGHAVAALARFHRISLPEILVIHDDLDLPTGTIRLKQAGGHGGRKPVATAVTMVCAISSPNWVATISRACGSVSVIPAIAATCWITCCAARPERTLIEQAIADTLRELPHIVAGEWAKAMQTLHSRRIETVSPVSTALSANRASE